MPSPSPLAMPGYTRPTRTMGMPTRETLRRPRRLPLPPLLHGLLLSMLNRHSTSLQLQMPREQVMRWLMEWSRLPLSRRSPSP